METNSWGIKVSLSEREAIERLARLEGATAKDAVMAAVRYRLDKLERGQQTQKAPAGSVLERLEAAGGVGLFEGPEDLSTNKQYLEGLGNGA